MSTRTRTAERVDAGEDLREFVDGQAEQKAHPLQRMSDYLGGAFSVADIVLIKDTVGRQSKPELALTNQELCLFLKTAASLGLNPMVKQIYAIKRFTKQGPQMTLQTSIDGYRVIAERTGCYAGQKPPEFMHDDKGNLIACRVTVQKITQGHLGEFTGEVFWDEYAPDDLKHPAAKFWKKMPHNQLAKCAEAQALRKGFPGRFEGVYVEDELHRADVEEMKRVKPTRVRSSTTKKRSEPPPPPASGPCDALGRMHAWADRAGGGQECLNAGCGAIDTEGGYAEEPQATGAPEWVKEAWRAAGYERDPSWCSPGECVTEGDICTRCGRVFDDEPELGRGSSNNDEPPEGGEEQGQDPEEAE